MKWIDKEIARERQRLERARRRFVRAPSEECLHDVRTTGRRLRSLLEDVGDLISHPKLRRRVKRAAAVTDAALDAAVLRALVEASVDVAEAGAAAPLLEQLREHERQATELACRRLERVSFR